MTKGKPRTNFDAYLQDQLRDPEFKKRFNQADRDWEVGMQLSELRRRAGLSQKELATRVGTTQQQISRLESPGYSGHSLRMLRRVAEVLDADVEVRLLAQSGRHRGGV